jgi:hypothetical protein
METSTIMLLIVSTRDVCFISGIKSGNVICLNEVTKQKIKSISEVIDFIKIRIINKKQNIKFYIEGSCLDFKSLIEVDQNLSDLNIIELKQPTSNESCNLDKEILGSKQIFSFQNTYYSSIDVFKKLEPDLKYCLKIFVNIMKQ